jgi:lysophospholipase L1-like esterase
MLARFASDVAANTPQWTLIEGGINDLNVSNSTAAAILSNLTAETTAALAAKSNVILLAILPGAYTANNLMAVRDTVNAGLAALANGSTVYYVDAGPYIGVARYGGTPAAPAGNTWNTLSSYDAGDHEHLNAAGYARVAQAVADTIQAHPRHN